MLLKHPKIRRTCTTRVTQNELYQVGNTTYQTGTQETYVHRSTAMMMEVMPKSVGSGSFSIDSIMSRECAGSAVSSLSLGGSPTSHCLCPVSPHELLASSSHQHHTPSDISSLRSSLHSHLLAQAQESALLSGATKPLYSQALAAAAGGNGLSSLEGHPNMFSSSLQAAAFSPLAASEHGLNALLQAKGMSPSLTFGSAAAAAAAANSAALGVPKHPFHLYSWFSRPGAYFAHRLPGKYIFLTERLKVNDRSHF